MKLAEFYGPPNRVQADPSTADGRIALRGLDEPDDPVVLPWDDGYRGMRWYVMAPAGSFEQLREELLANVGISYTDFRGQPTLLEEGDPGDAAVLRLGSPRQVLRISLVSARDRTAVSDAFWRFLDSWSGGRRRRCRPLDPRPRSFANTVAARRRRPRHSRGGSQRTPGLGCHRGREPSVLRTRGRKPF